MEAALGEHLARHLEHLGLAHRARDEPRARAPLGRSRHAREPIPARPPPAAGPPGGARPPPRAAPPTGPARSSRSGSERTRPVARSGRVQLVPFDGHGTGAPAGRAPRTARRGLRGPVAQDVHEDAARALSLRKAGREAVGPAITTRGEVRAHRDHVVVVGSRRSGATTCTPREPVVMRNGSSPASRSTGRQARAAHDVVPPSSPGGSRSTTSRSGRSGRSSREVGTWRAIDVVLREHAAASPGSRRPGGHRAPALGQLRPAAPEVREVVRHVLHEVPGRAIPPGNTCRLSGRSWTWRSIASCTAA